MPKQLKTKTQFKEALLYLKETKKYIYSSLIIFIISLILGFIFSDYLTFINDIIRKIILQTKDMNAPELIFYIMQNNLLVAILSILLGIFFGIYPILSSLANGAIAGYVISLVLKTESALSLWKLLPHGIFELPAIFISFGLGIKLGLALFLPKEIRAKEFKRRFYNSANALLMIVIPLLIIAAIIEGILISFIG